MGRCCDGRRRSHLCGAESCRRLHLMWRAGGSRRDRRPSSSPSRPPSPTGPLPKRWVCPCKRFDCSTCMCVGMSASQRLALAETLSVALESTSRCATSSCMYCHACKCWVFHPADCLRDDNLNAVIRCMHSKMICQKDPFLL